MEKDLVLIATTEEVLKYADKACVQASEEFRREFQLDSSRPFVNYFLHMIQNGNRRTSYHDNFSILTLDKFDPKPDLDGMVDKYLHVGIPGTTIRMVMPPLIITNAEARSEVLEAFKKAGYHRTVDLLRMQK
ncbi:hypothetical protein HYU07_03290 [Candidatus Woesearchaeota archaeon]|nr:hypothetical protein [Candidatus Woesearchaeota archaeon]